MNVVLSELNLQGRKNCLRYNKEVVCEGYNYIVDAFFVRIGPNKPLIAG